VTRVGSVSIVIPVHRQADHIERVLGEYVAALALVPVPCELIAVVNGTDDGSLEICRRVAGSSSSVRVIPLDESGWGNAVTAGLAAASGDLLCYTNSARTSGDDLRMFIEYGVANPRAVVKAERKIRDGWQRRVGSLLFNLECRALFNLFIWDINGTPKVFPRSFDKLLALSRRDDLIDLEFAVICQTAGYPMLAVPVFSTSRRGGRSTTNYTAALRMMGRAFRMARERRAGGRV
jgi:glycosyltransferase involved in cell wall biosynthesis